MKLYSKTQVCIVIVLSVAVTALSIGGIVAIFNNSKSNTSSSLSTSIETSNSVAAGSLVQSTQPASNQMSETRAVPVTTAPQYAGDYGEYSIEEIENISIYENTTNRS